MKKISSRQLMIFDEIFIVIAITWLIFMIVELIKPGIISNYYDLNLHFIVAILLLIGRLFCQTDD